MATISKEKRFPSATGLCDIRCRFWIPEEIRLCVLLVHGMAEHIDRYDDIARFLNANGILVAGIDLPSHGRSTKEGLPRGYFGKNDGWGCIRKDILTLKGMLRKEYPQTAIVLYGHSMGSFLVQDLMARNGKEFDGFILSGTSGPNFLVPFGRLICRHEIKKGRGEEPSEKLNAIAFGSYSASVRNPETPFDWLSRDREEVNKYIEDPLCGYAFTPYGYYDLMKALGTIASRRWAKKVPERPVFLLSGDCDPVGRMGKGVKRVYKNLMGTGHSLVAIKLYAGGRHEMHNEINRDEVFEDVLLFLESVGIQGECDS